MLYTLQNNQITVTVSDLGAEIISVRNTENCEYIWQADPAYWAGRAPILFPVCGRLTEGQYTYRGTSYPMNIHGFARKSVFAGEQLDGATVRFRLSATPDTKKVYPFAFELTVTYHLAGRTLSSFLTVQNQDRTVLPAAIGLHPGFRVPLEGGNFEDWYVEFDFPCYPDRLLFSETCYMTGKKEAFPLEGGTVLRLRHDLFDHDAIFLANAGHTLSLRSQKSQRYVTFSFPEFPYLGFWHAPKTQAPYVCIEPWFGLPAYDGVIDNLETKCDMFRLQPGTEKTVQYSLYFG